MKDTQVHGEIAAKHKYKQNKTNPEEIYLGIPVCAGTCVSGPDTSQNYRNKGNLKFLKI